MTDDKIHLMKWVCPACGLELNGERESVIEKAYDHLGECEERD